jgi:transcriptional regulator with XRE-family HTH domain
MGQEARQTILRRWTLEHAVDAMAAGLRLGVLSRRTAEGRLTGARPAGATSVAERLSALRQRSRQFPSAEPPEALAPTDAGARTDVDGLGGRVLQARHEAGLTTKELAERLNVSVWMTERLERGHEDVVPYLPAIASVTARPEGWFAQAPAPDQTDAPEHPEADPAQAPGAAETSPRTGAVSTLILAAVTLLLVIRAFTELLPILPRAGNFVDIPIFVALLLAALIRASPVSRTRELTPALVLGFLFLVVFTVATITNLSRVSPAPALMFLYGFLGPVGVFYAVHRLWIPGSAVRLSRVLVALGVLQLILAFGVQLPEYISSKNPDVISGTFGENAYQLVFFLLVLVGLLAGIFTFEKRRAVSRLVPVLLPAILVVILLAQYRSLLVTTVLTIVMLSALLATARGRGALIAVFATAGLLMTLAYVVQSIPELKFGSAIAQSREDPAFFLKKRFDPADVVGTLFSDEPRFMITGTGPGTYSSRGWQTFARAGGSASASNVAGEYVEVLTNGRPYTTDVSDKYVVPQLRDAEVVDGSRALSSPFSSYLSLLAEVGVLGFVLIVALYLWAFAYSLRMTLSSVRTAQDGDPLPALLCASTVAFFVLLQMAMFENWFEITRLTFLSWIIFAVVTKEFDARRLRA